MVDSTSKKVWCVHGCFGGSRGHTKRVSHFRYRGGGIDFEFGGTEYTMNSKTVSLHAVFLRAIRASADEVQSLLKVPIHDHESKSGAMLNPRGG